MSESIENLKAELIELSKQMNGNRLKFAKALGQGLSQEKAYVKAGYKSKNANADSAKAIAAYPVIAQYRDLFRKIAQLEMLPKEIATLEQKRQMLWDIANKAANLKVSVKQGHAIAGVISDEEEPLEIFDATSAKTAVSAIAELNKMDGHLAAIKTENRNFTVDSLIDELTSGDKQ